MAIKTAKMPVASMPSSVWRANLSASHRGPRPGVQKVQKPPKIPNLNKVRWR